MQIGEEYTADSNEISDSNLELTDHQSLESLALLLQKSQSWVPRRRRGEAENPNRTHFPESFVFQVGVLEAQVEVRVAGSSWWTEGDWRNSPPEVNRQFP